MINEIEKERLKDILIDFLYDYFFNQKVKVMEGDGIKLNIHPDANVDDDPVTKSLSESIKKSKNISLRYDLRDEKTCEVIKDKLYTHKDLTNRLQRLGFEKSDELGPLIHDSVEFLVDRSYLFRDQPIESKVGLTLKGIKHYESGQSFEDKYLQKELSVKADHRSSKSIKIAITSIIISGLIGVVGLWFRYSDSTQTSTQTKLPQDIINSLSLDYISDQIQQYGDNNFRVLYKPVLNSSQINHLKLRLSDSIDFNYAERALIRKLLANSQSGEERRILRASSSKVSRTVEIGFSKFLPDDLDENAVVFISQYFKNDSSNNQILGGWEQLNFYRRMDTTWIINKEIQITEY